MAIAFPWKIKRHKIKEKHGRPELNLPTQEKQSKLIKKRSSYLNLESQLFEVFLSFKTEYTRCYLLFQSQHLRRSNYKLFESAK